MSPTEQIKRNKKKINRLNFYNCNYCGSSKLEKLYDVKRQNKTFAVVRCDCGLIFMNPRLSSSELDSYYDEEYFAGEKKGFTSWQKFPENLKESVIDLPKMDFRDSGRFLDIGCGIGVYVAYMKNKGWDAHGIDISKYCTDYGRSERGLNLICGTLEKANFENDYFHAIYMRDVIEHLDEPAKILKEVSRILHPDGWLFITTGNIGSIVAKIRMQSWFFFQVDHIHYFSLRSLQRMLKSAGLEIVKLGSEYCYGRSISEIQKRNAPRLWIRVPEYIINSKLAPAVFKYFGSQFAEPFAITMSLHCRKMRK